MISVQLAWVSEVNWVCQLLSLWPLSFFLCIPQLKLSIKLDCVISTLNDSLAFMVSPLRLLREQCYSGSTLTYTHLMVCGECYIKHLANHSGSLWHHLLAPLSFSINSMDNVSDNDNVSHTLALILIHWARAVSCQSRHIDLYIYIDRRLNVCVRASVCAFVWMRRGIPVAYWVGLKILRPCCHRDLIRTIDHS